MNRFWLGTDVAKRKLDVALLDTRGKIKSRVFTNNAAGHVALMQWLEERGAIKDETHVCLESTGPYSEAPAIALSEAGWKVSIVNPAQPKKFAESELLRNKTDQVDAALLARYCAKMEPELWQPPSLAHRQLRALVDRLQALKDMRQQEANRLEGHDDSSQQKLRESIEEHLSWLDERIAELEQQIDDHIDGHKDTLGKDVKLICSIPGIGRTTVAKVLAYVGDLRRFKSGKALAAFIGVTPQRIESGTSVKGRSKISRMGNAYVRQALFMPALVAARHNPLIKVFRQRLLLAGKTKKSSAVAVMHKLVHLMYGVIRSGVPFDPKYGQPALDMQDGI